MEMEFYKEETGLIRRITKWITDIVVAIGLAVFLVHAFGGQASVAGNSMLPLLNSDDVVLINQLSYKFREPERFEVVVFEREDKKHNIKRVIGLPGETVQIKNGTVLIDGRELTAEAGLEKVSLAGLAENPVVLGEEEYFLLGDNRDSSEDSRFSNVGNIREDQIKGKVWFRLYPVFEFGWIK